MVYLGRIFDANLQDSHKEMKCACKMSHYLLSWRSAPKGMSLPGSSAACQWREPHGAGPRHARANCFLGAINHWRWSTILLNFSRFFIQNVVEFKSMIGVHQKLLQALQQSHRAKNLRIPKEVAWSGICWAVFVGNASSWDWGIGPDRMSSPTTEALMAINANHYCCETDFKGTWNRISPR